MRKPDPQTHLRSPVPQGDDKGAMILGSRMTRADLLDYIRTKRREAEEKRNYQPPPPPPTERQLAQTALEIAAGQRRLKYFADIEARRLGAANHAEQRGKAVGAPEQSANAVGAPGQDANATTLETQQPPEVANEADKIAP
jgi:hypothetical protein